jgi:hypothetical protein
MASELDLPISAPAQVPTHHKADGGEPMQVDLVS